MSWFEAATQDVAEVHEAETVASCSVHGLRADVVAACTCGAGISSMWPPTVEQTYCSGLWVGY